MAIETLSNIPTTFTSAEEYCFECSCGEQFNCDVAASSCKKCRIYSVWGYTKYVIDTRNGEVVYGNLPSEEEYNAAAVIAEARWELERQQLEFDMQMWRKEGELYDAEMLRQAEEKKLALQEAEEDALWDIQDSFGC